MPEPGVLLSQFEAQGTYSHQSCVLGTPLVQLAREASHVVLQLGGVPL